MISRRWALPLLFVAALSLLGSAPNGYSRSDWMPSGWIDENKNCRDTRQEVLIRDSNAPVLFRDARRCEVAWGQWRDPYSGEIVNDPSKIDVDHLVPLAWAHRHGGAEWTRERKRAYANDLTYRAHLKAVSARLNRQKGAKGPAGWRPPDKSKWCAYAEQFSTVLILSGLTPHRRDRDAIQEMAATCPAR